MVHAHAPSRGPSVIPCARQRLLYCSLTSVSSTISPLRASLTRMCLCSSTPPRRPLPPHLCSLHPDYPVCPICHPFDSQIPKLGASSSSHGAIPCSSSNTRSRRGQPSTGMKSNLRAGTTFSQCHYNQIPRKKHPLLSMLNQDLLSP